MRRRLRDAPRQNDGAIRQGRHPSTTTRWSLSVLSGGKGIGRRLDPIRHRVGASEAAAGRLGYLPRERAEGPRVVREDGAAGLDAHSITNTTKTC